MIIMNTPFQNMHDGDMKIVAPQLESKKRKSDIDHERFALVISNRNLEEQNARLMEQLRVTVAGRDELQQINWALKAQNEVLIKDNTSLIEENRQLAADLSGRSI